MNRFVPAFFIAAWEMVGTFLLSRLWYANPDMFPKFPDSFWQVLDRLTGTRDVDQAADVELLVVVSLAFVATTACATIAIAVWRHAKKA